MWVLQAGSFVNAFGNGVVFPFLLIYLHNVRGFALGTSGLALATTGVAALAVGPVVGALVDRVGARTMLAAAMVLSAVGFGLYPLVRSPWHAFALAIVAGAGNGAFWPAQSTLLAALSEREGRHTVYAMQRVTNNLGIGLGGVAGGLIATTAHPGTYTALFLLDAVTFVLYLATLVVVPAPSRRVDEPRERRGYSVVLRDRVLVAFLLLDTLLVATGFAFSMDLLPVFAKNHAGVDEQGIGLIFLANTLVIVVVQLPISQWLEGRRRMAAYALEAALWTGSWLIVLAAGIWLKATPATVAFAVAIGIFGVGECFHGTVRGALLADMARPGLLGRTMALSAFSFQTGTAAGRAVGGFVLAAWPLGLWVLAAAVAATGGLVALALERSIPAEIRRTPRRLDPAPAGAA